MSGPGELRMGLKCIKYLLVAFNALFAVSGVLLVLTAAMVGRPISQLLPLLERSYISPAVFLGTVGLGVIVVSCLGAWGAMRHSTALVNTFSVLLALLLMMELGVGLSSVFALNGGLRESLRHNLNAAMQRYDTDRETAHAIDIMQSGLQCCGAMDAFEWIPIRGPSNMPPSCCELWSVDAAVSNTSYTLPDTYDEDAGTCIAEYQVGCLTKLMLFVGRGSAVLASTAVLIAFTQFLGIIFACILGHSIRREKTLREMHRSQIRERLINCYAPFETKQHLPTSITN